MRRTFNTIRNNILSPLLCLGIFLILHNCHDDKKYLWSSDAKEIVPTKEWQRVEGNDTIPGGMHVRMDMTTGEKWVKIMDEEDEEAQGKDSNDINVSKNVNINRGSTGKSSVSVAVVESDGNIETKDDDEDETKNKTFRNTTNYNFEMMHRTLSKLPPEEIEAMGGLPDVPDSEKGPLRIAFEERMLEIWKKRQAELLDLEMNFPEVLKARIKGIAEYIEDPQTQLKTLNLDADVDEDAVTDIISLLKDLEFQLSDIDMARDFHTMNGWPLLVKLLLEETHIPANNTIEDLSQSIKTKIRSVQSHAAWVIGTAVKNTEEFFPYGVESVVVEGNRKSTAIDALIDVFCYQYDDSSSWVIRTLLAKSIYAIGAIVRGNQLAQTYAFKSDGFTRLGQKYRELSHQGFNSENMKLIQRIVQLSTDLVEDLSLHIDLSENEMDTSIINSLSSTFCDSTCELFPPKKSVPARVQETLVKGIAVMSPYCNESKCATGTVRSIVKAIQSDWLSMEKSFDADHFQELQDMIAQAFDSLSSQTEKK